MFRLQKRHLLVIGCAIVVLGGGGVFFAFKQDGAEVQLAGRGRETETLPSLISAPSSTNVERRGDGGAQDAPSALLPAVVGASAPRLIGALAPLTDWKKYPGTLHSQVNKALESRDGAMAMDLAAKLFECSVLDRMLSSQSREAIGPTLSGEAQAGWMRRKAEDQRILANCQTVGGGYQEQRQRLLELALEQKIVGAAYDLFALGLRRPDVVQSVAADAAAGDVRSLIFAVAYPASVLGLQGDSQAAMRYGFELATRNELAGPLLQTYYNSAQLLAAALGSSPGGKFDNAGVSQAAKAEGAVLAERILERVRSNK